MTDRGEARGQIHSESHTQPVRSSSPWADPNTVYLFFVVNWQPQNQSIN